MKGKMSEWAPLPLRLVLGISFIYHGYPKLFTVEGHQGFAGMLTKMRVPAPGLMSWLVAGVEVVGGAALIIGAVVAVASLLLLIDMLVALFKVHLAAGFSFMNIKGMGPQGPIFGMPGYEVNLLIIAGLLTLMLTGAGALSVGQIRGKR